MPTNDTRIRYAIVDSDGLIQRISNVESEVLPIITAEPGEQLVFPVPESVGDLTHRWNYSTETWTLLPPRPEAPHYWKDGAWHLYPPSPHPEAEFDRGTGAWIDLRSDAEKVAAFEAYRSDALRRLTALRGRARLAYITDLPGQDMLYIVKAEEAAGYLSDPEPDPAQYPLIQSEVGVTAPTAYEVAQIFSNLNMLWRHAAGSIDAACFQAEAAVQQAPDRETIDLILANLEATIT